MDLARVAAISSVILLHSIFAPSMAAMNQDYVYRWWTWNVYSSLAWFGVPLFIMITGALMLRPEKADEPLGTFFRKRWKRIGVPLIFWGAAYALYDVIINHVSVTWDFAFRTIVTGPYFQFWYIYMLIGLYLATPILRVLIAHISRKLFTYFMTLWLFGVCLQPLWNFIYGHNSSYFLNIPNFFLWGGFLGCYLFGAYLRDVKLKQGALWTAFPCLLVAGGILLSIFGNYFVSETFSQTYNYVIWENTNGNILMIAAGMFLILTRIKYTNPLFSFISKNTLPIYMGHVMFVEMLSRGTFGFAFNADTVSVALEAPLMVAIALLVTVSVLVPLKKVPVLNRFIG
jgi:surface polysaccharide O-acyltransferase-like enzyme